MQQISTLKGLNFFYKNLGSQRGFHKCLSQLFPIHLNTYVMGLRLIEFFLLLLCGDRLQTLTTKVYPRAVMLKSIEVVDRNSETQFQVN